MPTSPDRKLSVSAVVLAGAALTFAGSMSAQCSTQWRNDGPFGVLADQAWSVALWDADRSGPLQPQLVAGRHTSIGNVGTIVRWDEVSAAWVSLGVANGRPQCMLVAANGDLLVGGDFTTINGVTVDRLARFDGTSWSSVGGGVSFGATPAYVYAMAELPGGDLVVGGFFSSAGGVAAANLARWNGTSWSPFGVGANGDVRAIAVAPGGELVVGGSFSQMDGVAANKLARWSGNAWTAIGTGLNSTVRDVAMRADGSLVVACIDPYVWDGSSWSLVAGNSTYQTEVVVLPNGDLITGGLGGTLQRWNGTTWTTLGPGTSATVNDALPLPNGDIVFAGQFSASGTPLPSVMALTTTCPATVDTLGGGCAGLLEAHGLPWAGGTYGIVASELPAPAFAVAVRGFQQFAIGLDLLFPSGVPGCVLGVTPDFLLFVVPDDGDAAVEIALPNTPVILGLELFEQWVTFELTPTLDFATVTATNVLRSTIGVF